MSQNLGHRVYDSILRENFSQDPSIHATWMPIEPWADDVWQKIPGIRGNLTLLSGLRARAHLRREKARFDLLYCHTQEAATLLGSYMRRIPTVLSMDATPLNMDKLGRWYQQKDRSALLERAKHVVTRSAFERAAHLVAFSDWARASLIADYGIAASKITVIPPGIDLALWDSPREKDEGTQARILFVGGAFERKGGHVLLEAVARMPASWQVDIVTDHAMHSAPGMPNVRFHSAFQPGSAELRSLYRQANIFVLPTFADCSPWVNVEAMAMRLPVITTPVGGTAELIDEHCGIVVQPGSADELLAAVSTLAANPELRRAMGEQGRLRAERYFDTRRNSRRLADLLKSLVQKSGQRDSR